MAVLNATLLLLLLAVTLDAARVGDPCKDFAQRSGECAAAPDCSPVVKVVQQLSVATPAERSEIIQELRSSVCGSNGRRLLICCAKLSAPFRLPKPPVTEPTPVEATTASSGTPGQGRSAGENGASPGENAGGNPKRSLLPPRDSCGIATLGERIVGGTEVQIGAHPWLAAIGYKVMGQDAVQYQCGGSLISDRYILTAAHCVTQLPEEFTVSTIRLGEHDLNKTRDCQGVAQICADPPLDIDIEEVVPHDNYSTPIRFRNDIALIRLARPVNFTEFVGPVCLPLDEDRNATFEEHRLTVLGFGLTSARGERSTKLLEVAVPVVPLERCQPIFRRQGADIGPTQLCAGGERLQDSCSGDSGGPLVGLTGPRQVPPSQQVGVVSFGSVRCGTRGVPGIYTRVTEYLDWILENMRE